MKWIIDRFEEDFAVVGCNDIYFNVPKNVLPADAAEGDVMEIKVDAGETEEREKQLKDRLKKLFGE